MKVNTDALRNGDIAFTSGWFPLGWITRLVTKGSRTHVGIVVKDEHETYVAEMIGDFDFSPDDSDLECNEISKYTKPWNKLVSVKRNPLLFKTRWEQQALLDYLRNIKSNYDYRELWSHVSGRSDRNRQDLICSGLVYRAYAKFGHVWDKEYHIRGYAPAPEEIYDDGGLVEVVGWKK